MQRPVLPHSSASHPSRFRFAGRHCVFVTGVVEKNTLEATAIAGECQQSARVHAPRSERKENYSTPCCAPAREPERRHRQPDRKFIADWVDGHAERAKRGTAFGVADRSARGRSNHATRQSRCRSARRTLADDFVSRALPRLSRREVGHALQFERAGSARRHRARRTGRGASACSTNGSRSIGTLWTPHDSCICVQAWVSGRALGHALAPKAPPAPRSRSGNPPATALNKPGANRDRNRAFWHK